MGRNMNPAMQQRYMPTPTRQAQRKRRGYHDEDEIEDAPIITDDDVVRLFSLFLFLCFSLTHLFFSLNL